jgi:diguanylate cyclase (GGDEF)-like protein/PAS domain S-box-containing protein
MGEDSYLPSKEDLQTILRELPDLYFRLDSEGVFVDYHCKNKEDLPAAPEHFLGHKLSQVLPFELVQPFENALAKVAETRTPFQLEYALKIQGKERLFEAQVVPFLQNEFLLLIRNITARKATEIALQEANERFLLASSAVNIAIYDWHIQKNQIIWMNGLSDVFGYPADLTETTDQWWIDRVHPEDRQSVLDRIESQLSHEKDFVIEYRMLNSKEEYRFVQDQGRLLKDEEGKVTRVVGSIVDITEKKRIKQSLHLMMEVIASASEAEDNRALIAHCLEKICALDGWELGQAWFFDDKDGMLFCSHSFYSELESPEFRRESLRLRLAKDSDLPGEVWNNMGPVWWSDISAAPAFTRKAASEKAGLKSAFAFPLITEGRIQAVFEFFTKHKRDKDDHLLGIASRVGPHLGLVFERKQERDNLRYQAYHDLLTGLPNRTLLEDRFLQALAHARRNSLLMAVLFLDLDRFKNINDRLGHQIGDLFLRAVGQRLSNSLREVDTVARLGGDEFMILLPQIKEIQDAAKTAQKILQTFESPFYIEGQPLQTSTSIGISLYPHDGDDLQTLMKNADIALYRAKEKGRNNYQLYTPSMTVTALARLKMERDLRVALDRNQFLLYYQPQLDVRSGMVVGIEALLRWQHPDMGLFLPAEFLPTAEESGHLISIWEWALRTACTQMSSWRQNGIDVPLITMNVPPNQLQSSSHLVQIISGALDNAKLQARALELEVAQTGRVSMDLAIPVIREIKSLGIRIALDDFGAGNTSFVDVKRFPMDTIKIDPVFIQGAVSDSGDRAILASMIGLARGLHLRVVAEGVETEEQLAFLRANHCDAIQGFFFCRPLPAESLTEFLTQAQP